MTSVRMPCMLLERMEAAANNGGQPILTLTLQLTATQRREALLSLLEGIPEQEAFGLMRGEFPEWFKGEGA